MAAQFVQARIAGNASATLTGPSGWSVTLDEGMLDECQKFDRVCVELVLGWAPSWCSDSAYDTEQALLAQGYSNLLGTVDHYLPGSIMFFNLRNAPPGHVTIVGAAGLLCQDTVYSGGTPYAPGIKEMTWTQMLNGPHPEGPSGVYAVVPWQTNQARLLTMVTDAP